MTSVRRAAKKAKNRANQNVTQATLSRRGFSVVARLFCGEYPKSGFSELDAVLIRRLARLKQLNTRLERKKRKQGKWQEWQEFKAFVKRQQESLLQPWMLGLDYPPNDGFSFDKYLKYLQNRVKIKRNEQQG